ncbi:MAG: hypothetical protein ACQER0_08575 [Bacillota bacterium]
MEKLSEAGKLFLEDYLVLNEAKNDVDRYLNTVVRKVHDIILEQLDDFTSEDLRLNIWENKSTRGRLQVRFESLTEHELFRKNKYDLYIMYRDIRNATDLFTNNSVKLYLYSPAVVSNLEDTLIRLSQEKLDYNIYNKKVIELDLNSSTQTAEKIAEEIFDMINIIKNLLNEIYKS